MAARRGWRTGRGTASAVEGPWPYAPVLEAFNDLCRKHPALLDGLDDVYRVEIERALSGREVSWSGESSHQRLFVAVAELIRLAAAGHGLLLVVDDVHEADDASLRLLHYLSRCAMTEPVLIVVAHRPLRDQPLREVADSLIARGAGVQVGIDPLVRAAPPAACSRIAFPTCRPSSVERNLDGQRRAAVHGTGAGAQPWRRHARRAVGPSGSRDIDLPRAALLGSTFTTDELLAVSGVDEDETYRHLDAALSAMVVERTEAGLPVPARARPRRSAAGHAAGRPVDRAAGGRCGAGARRMPHPGGSPTSSSRPGYPSRAVPYALRAVETAGALGAYRDALA